MLDLGCAPGAWLQVACQALGRGDKGLVLGVDLKPVAVPAQHCDRRVRTLQADVNSLSESALREHAPQVGTVTRFKHNRRQRQQSCLHAPVTCSLVIGRTHLWLVIAQSC